MSEETWVLLIFSGLFALVILTPFILAGWIVWCETKGEK